ncbi:Exocyst complex component 8 [Halotydeus destructor]|nr:Exocyst complex component 8 [Halotydeus destructor]
MNGSPGRVSEFDPDAYVRELNKPSVGVDSLMFARNKVQTMVDDTNVSLKRNVYKNYALFIDTAREISLLKNEMYTLSHLLTEEQALLANLIDVSISGDKSHGLTLTEKKEVAAKFRSDGHPQESLGKIGIPKSHSAQVINSNSSYSAKELNNVVDKIEGCSGMLETRNRSLLNYGEATELDPNDYSRIPNQGKTLIVLLNDCLVLAQAYPFPSRLGKRYKFQSQYELDNIAVVNVKDMNVKCAFKVLMFPQYKVYEVESPEAKKKWIDSFEMAKKHRKASLTLQRRDSLMYLSSNLSLDGLNAMSNSTSQKTLMSPSDRPGYSFEEVAELLEDGDESESEQLPLWLQEVPEDIDVMIAQRNFEDAVILVHKAKEHVATYPKCYDGFMQTDLKLRVNNKIQELVDTIANELQTTPDRSIQSGPRSARRAVHLLLRLGKSSMATKLFLSQRTALLKFSLKQQIAEGAVLQYIKRMSSVFFNNIIDSCREFEKVFHVNITDATRDTSSLGSVTDRESLSLGTERLGYDKSPSSSFPAAYPLASLVSWVQVELQCFFDTFSRTVFMPQVPAAISSECVSIIRNHCNRLRTSLGLDLLFYLDQLLKEELDRIILETSDNIVEVIKGRKHEEKWLPQSFGTKSNLNKFVEEMKECGLFIMNTFVYDETKISLAHSTSSFSKSFLNMANDLLKLSTPFTHQSIVEALEIAFKAQMSFVEMALRGEYKREEKFIRRNAAFLLESVLPIAEQRYSEKVGVPCPELEEVRKEYDFLRADNGERKRKSSKSDATKNDGKLSSTVTYL